MHLKETLSKILRLFFGDTRQAVISYIVLALIAMGGGLLALSKAALNFSIQIMTTATPLWATISLVLLGYLYIYLRFRSSSIPPQNVVLDKDKIKILQCLATQYSEIPLPIITQTCQQSFQVAQFHLQELEDKSLIELSNVDYQKMWAITHEGRAYLMKHRLLH